MSNDAAGLTLLMGTTSPMLGSFTGKMPPWEPVRQGENRQLLEGKRTRKEEGGRNRPPTGRKSAPARGDSPELGKQRIFMGPKGSS